MVLQCVVVCCSVWGVIKTDVLLHCFGSPNLHPKKVAPPGPTAHTHTHTHTHVHRGTQYCILQCVAVGCSVWQCCCSVVARFV